MPEQDEQARKAEEYKKQFEEYERRQEALESALKDSLCQLELVAKHYEKEGESEKAAELRAYLAKLHNDMEGQKP